MASTRRGCSSPPPAGGRLTAVYDILVWMLEPLREPVPDLQRAEQFAAQNGWPFAVAGVRDDRFIAWFHWPTAPER